MPLHKPGRRQSEQRGALFAIAEPAGKAYNPAMTCSASDKRGIAAKQLISCDDHMDLGQLPDDLWTTRLPPALQDRAPHIEERDGQAVWICDGKVWGSWGGKPPATGNQR